MTLGEILNDHVHDIALVVGNGIHRHGTAGVNSWDQLLIDLARQHGLMVDHLPRGATATEFYDLIDLRNGAASGDLAAAFCAEMKDWPVQQHHQRIMDWAVRHRVPVMTTNFDEVLSNAAAAKLMRPNAPGFTYWYPWDSCFAHQLRDDPCDGFAEWHINGLARYKRSVRLGLTHYVGSAQRAREWLHRGGNRLFEAKDKRNWPGRRTWLHLLFNKPLLFFGLGLREDEVFLRWLLIERERYFRKFPDRRQPGWFVFTHQSSDKTQAGRVFFLNGIGIECVRTEGYSEIYDIPAWEH